MSSLPGMDDIRAASERIRPYVHQTPVHTSQALDSLCGGSLFFKCENLQKIGAFKIRGATNALLKLPAQRLARGVATHSSGNHAAAVALAARSREVEAHVVMPESAPSVKKAAVLGYGAEILFTGDHPGAREQALDELIDRTGAYFVHPYDDPDVIEGQGTAALELMRQVPDLDMVITPIGGGGLISGTALAVHGLRSRVRIIGVEPAGADEAMRSLKSGRRTTLKQPASIADGLLAPVSERTLGIIAEHVEEVFSVEEEEIGAAMRMVWERMKLVIEPSAAVPVAALLSDRMDLTGLRVGVILTGGNVDLQSLPWNRQAPGPSG